VKKINKTLIRVAMTLSLILFSSGVSAQSGPCSTAGCGFAELPRNVYLSAFLDRQSLGVNDTNTQLRPVVLSGALGYWVLPGVGLELEAGVGVKDDTVGTLSVKFESKLAVNLRLESPPVNQVAAYAMFGYSRTNYDAVDRGINNSISLPGGRVALGLTYGLSRGILVDTAFTHHNYDRETRINSFRVGIRFDLGS